MPSDSSGTSSDPPQGVGPRPCPLCGKPSVDAFKPFCSKRCADVDLHRWLGGRYAIPVSDDGAVPDEDEDGGMR